MRTALTEEPLEIVWCLKPRLLRQTIRLLAPTKSDKAVAYLRYEIQRAINRLTAIPKVSLERWGHTVGKAINENMLTQA